MSPYGECGDVICPPTVAKRDLRQRSRCQADGCAETGRQRVAQFVVDESADADSEGNGAGVRYDAGSSQYVCTRCAADRAGVSTGAFDGFGDGMGGADESEELGWSP
jgi:hypothetical protein